MRSHSQSLSLVLELLPLWMLLSAVLGLISSFFFPAIAVFLEAIQPFFLVMLLFPALVHLFYHDVAFKPNSSWVLRSSLIFNFMVNPILGYLICTLLLNSSPEISMGFLLMVLFPSISLSLIWIDLSGGNRYLGSWFLMVNAIGQFVFVPIWVFLFFGVGIWPDLMLILRMLLLYVGLPGVMAWLLYFLVIRKNGFQFFSTQILPPLDRLQIYAFLGLVTTIFGYRGSLILEFPEMIWLLFWPLVIYFLLLFLLIWIWSRYYQIRSDQAMSLSFSCLSRNFTVAYVMAQKLLTDFPLAQTVTLFWPMVEIPLLLLFSLSLKYYKDRLFLKEIKTHD